MFDEKVQEREIVKEREEEGEWELEREEERERERQIDGCNIRKRE